MRWITLILVATTLLMYPALAETVSVGTYTVRPGEEFAVDVVASNLTNISGFDIRITFDPTALELLSYNLGENIGQNFHFDQINNSAGRARFIIVTKSVISTDSMVILTLNFRARNDSGDAESVLGIYAEMSRVTQDGNGTSFKTVYPECSGGIVYISGQPETKPTRTPAPSPVLSGGSTGSYHEEVPETTPTPEQNQTELRDRGNTTGVNLTSTAVENAGMNASTNVSGVMESGNRNESSWKSQESVETPVESGINESAGKILIGNGSNSERVPEISGDERQKTAPQAEKAGGLKIPGFGFASVLAGLAAGVGMLRRLKW